MDKDAERERVKVAEAEYRRRNRDLGMIQCKIWVHREDVTKLKNYGEALRGFRGIILDQRRKDAIRKTPRIDPLDKLLKLHRRKASSIEAADAKSYRESRRKG